MKRTPQTEACVRVSNAPSLTSTAVISPAAPARIRSVTCWEVGQKKSACPDSLQTMRSRACSLSECWLICADMSSSSFPFQSKYFAAASTVNEFAADTWVYVKNRVTCGPQTWTHTCTGHGMVAVTHEHALETSVKSLEGIHRILTQWTIPTRLARVVEEMVQRWH